MGIILWIVFGAIVGWIASILMKSNSGVIGDIILGIVGSLVGGFLFSLVNKAGVSGFNAYSFGVAIIGSCVVILIGRAIRGNKY